VSRDPIDRPAPGRLELVRAFVNTRDIDKAADRLSDAETAIAWLDAAGLLPPPQADELSDQPDPGTLEQIVRVREAFRAVLVANAEGTAARAAVHTLNRVAAEADIRMRLSGPGTMTPVVVASGVEGALGKLVAIAFEAIADETWRRLKACPADTCHWAFYDASRNRSSRWCDMGICGNRAKREGLRRRREQRTD
jgi:predicted RNA-binding Zn ribbon-like protein